VNQALPTVTAQYFALLAEFNALCSSTIAKAGDDATTLMELKAIITPVVDSTHQTPERTAEVMQLAVEKLKMYQ